MTSIIEKTLTRFRTTPSRGGKPQVDREGGHFGAGLITGFSAITRGEALGHYAWVDQFAVEQVVKLGNSARNGIKMRFTHPGLSADGMGTLLGRAKNFRIEGERALADLHFEKSSHQTPDGDLAKYVMDLAEEDAEAFGTSIVFDHDFGEEDRFEAEHEDEDGYFRSPDDDNTSNYRHIRLSKLWATDVVDEPAANPGGLFRKGHEIAYEADRLCEYALGLSSERPALQHLSADADRLAQYAARFLESHNLEIRSKEMASDPTVKVDVLNADVLKAFSENLLVAVDEKIKSALAKQTKSELLQTDPGDQAKERKRCLDIFALAEKSGLDDYTKLANEAIEGGLTLEQFGQSIAQRRIASNGLSKDSGSQPPDADAKYKAEYRQQAAAFAAMGLTEAEYITSRKIDDGAEILAPKQPAA
jgi:hypothetical protein